MDESDYSASKRQKMVDGQLVTRQIADPRVLAAMGNVPRHLFVPEEYRHQAYADGPLPIGSGQTISQPYIVALMTQLLELEGDETVLEIGTGSGYQAAILADLAAKVYTIERHPDLAERAREVLDELKLNNVEVIVGDGSLGLPEHTPYQAIMVTAAAPEVPRPLLEQLTENGRLVIPVGGMGGQSLQVWVRHGEAFSHQSVLPVAFVPLRGKLGWESSRW